MITVGYGNWVMMLNEISLLVWFGTVNLVYRIVKVIKTFIWLKLKCISRNRHILSSFAGKRKGLTKGLIRLCRCLLAHEITGDHQRLVCLHDK